MKIIKILIFLCLFLLVFNFYNREPKKILSEEIYLSSQPTKKKLLKFINKYKIKSVINLRGENEGKRWFEEERDFLEEKNILFFNLKLSKDKDFPRWEALKFLKIFEEIKYPVLIHCRDGYDRSYFFAKLLMNLKDKDLGKRFYKEAKIWSFFESYKSFLKEKNIVENSKNLKYFIEKEYIPEDFKYSLFFEKNQEISKDKEFLIFKVNVINESKKIWILKNNLKEGIRLGAKIFGPFKELPEDLEDYFYENEGKGIDIVRAGIEEGKIYPEEERVFEFSFKPPRDEGFYFLAIDMVDENVNWFYYYGKAPEFYCFKIY